MTKILIVNNLLGYYGAENVLINLVNNLDDKKYDVTLLTLIESSKEQLNQNVSYRYIFSNNPNMLNRINNKIKIIIGYKNLAQVYCNGFDIAIAFKMGECARIVADCDANYKYCWIHSNVSDLNESCSYSYINIDEEKKFLASFTALVAVSQSCRDSFILKYGDSFKVKVIYNPVDVNKIIKLSECSLNEDDKKIFQTDCPIIGTVARIDSQKGINRLLSISKKLMNESLKHRMIIVGDGKDFEFYSKEIKNNNLSCVKMVGFRDNPYPLMKKFNLFICSSIWESYSIVLNEALVIGLPVISTKCGGPEEVLKNGKYGVLVENDTESLYQAIRCFLCGEFPSVQPYLEDPLERFIKDVEDLFRRS